MKKVFVSIASFCLCVGILLPVISAEKAEKAKSADQVKAELKAMKERKPQTVCPISGKPIAEGQGFTYMGYRIKTCCPNCPKAVEKDPLSAILKIRQKGEEIALADGVKAQSKCPSTGEAINADVFAIKNNLLVNFCCADCIADYKKDPAGTVKKMVEKGEAPIILTMAQTMCPVSGEKISGKNSAIVKSKKVELCCDDCKKEMEKNPDKYLEAMADEGIVLANVK